ncbi:DUF2726 domain-containing protein [Wielerella bovis]|uniref:DUF2726 domain-containing protein n=1 Tax=Wielerella bovis TaxID=2917790 RepID=UPI0020194E2B|nr:DUF2726 domain-containing protein [Wielerella bovis]ULJ63473.1 DUF2726 domain-containing protein [Wielerella bovis]
MMYWFIALLLLIFFLFLLPCIILKRKEKNPFKDKKRVLPYFRRPLMTPTELDVYAILLEALPKYMIFSQVQASRVLDVPVNKETYYWFNFVSRLSYDFVICRTDSTPIAAIEIDDSSHDLPERQEVDFRKDRATLTAGVAMIRWKVGETPDVKEIAELIEKIDKKAA